MAVTKKTNVIIPEIMGPAIGAKLDKALAMMPYAAVDNTLEGKEGDEVTIPVWDYAGDAVEVAEGEEVPTSDLACNVRKYKVKKAMKAFPITDEATESAFGNPGEEAERQILMSIKGKVEQDLIDACYGGNVVTVEHNGALDYTAIVRAVAAFSFESNPDKVLFINPAQEESLLLNPYFQDKSKFGEAVGIDGVIGKIAGCWVKKSKRIEYVEPTTTHGGYWKNVIVIVQNEKLDDEDPTAALTIFSKKGITLETQRDALNQTEAIVGSKHYIATLTNSRKVIIAKNIVAPALPFTLTYDGNGGTGTVEAQTAPGGTAVTLRANAFEKEGLTFMKWNTKADGTGTDYEPGDSFTLNEDVTLYAVWGYEISFNANGGTGSMDSLKVVAGESTSLPENTLTDSPYSFLRWNTAADGSGTDYADGASVTPAAAMTLYAIFGSVITVTNNSETATGGCTHEALKGETVAISTLYAEADVSNPGYTHPIWMIDGNNNYYTENITPTGDITLYVWWNIKVGYNKNGGTGSMQASEAWQGNAITIKACTFTRSGYTFVKWNTAANGSGTDYAPGAELTSIQPDGHLTLYAQWATETPSADPFAGKSFTLEDDGTYISAVFDSNGQYQLQMSEDGTTWAAAFAAEAYTVVNNTVEIDVTGPEPVTASLDGNGDLRFDAGGTPVTMSADATPKSILPYTEPDESEGE